ncbi:hypothetical protein FZEAL_2538 [Fusarium zealandicum]|uniref:LisH domain-containing protein n=1 Tax=Fusarium zealandicum TaxID=1053134 RepID=A0A8H4UQJ1_9HYPO|nr:hypothetical protein FZEAL_2538 [Fusarium zealandicum]
MVPQDLGVCTPPFAEFDMLSDQDTSPDYLSSPIDYHGLLIRQIYDYFLSVGLRDCAKAMLHSNCYSHCKEHPFGQLQHTRQGGNISPPSSSLGYDSSCASPEANSCLTAPHDPSNLPQGSDALYQWFSVFWTSFCEPFASSSNALYEQNVAFQQVLL